MDLASTLDEAMEHLSDLEAVVGAGPAAPLRQTMLRLRSLIGQSAGSDGTTAQESVDEARFRRLLEIAGPDTANELVHRLHLDLKSTRERLDEAMAAIDWMEIRAQTHVLMSLAGTVGAGDLQRLSEELNAAAHQHDRDQAAGLKTELLMRLDGLLAFVAQQRDGA
ncbi:hypothetical protein [Rhodobacter sp. NSM]|uniref:hypothetical protein n=1 Tax=Rhodobacter sp. NSM TaxID=3457501 RepID=UPI003FD5D8AE